MVDAIVEAIRTGKIDADNISVQRLRANAGRDCGCWGELNRGRAILSSHDHLDQYLYSYAPMTINQWNGFLPTVTLPGGILRILDYGCGQGLATAILFDQYGKKLLKQVNEIVLIEPSKVALNRAAAIVRCYHPKCVIRTVNKKLDELTDGDLESNDKRHSIHLFSNVLDINGFDQFAVFKKLCRTKGQHTVLSVSHNRSFYGGTSRLRTLADAISDPKHKPLLKVHESTLREFTSTKLNDAVSWQLRLEVM